MLECFHDNVSRNYNKILHKPYCLKIVNIHLIFIISCIFVILLRAASFTSLPLQKVSYKLINEYIFINQYSILYYLSSVNCLLLLSLPYQ